jgi:ribosomal-protein-alanine N-acetyltransferase
MSRLPPKIRNIRAEDFEALYEIDRICFPVDIAFSRAELLFNLNHARSIARVAYGPGRILGFVLARLETPSRAHILTLDVAPEVRKRGIGTSLMNSLHGELRRRGMDAAILEVGVRNVPAQRLYEKLQYQYLGAIPGYYHGGEDAYRMARLL